MSFNERDINRQRGAAIAAALTVQTGTSWTVDTSDNDSIWVKLVNGDEGIWLDPDWRGGNLQRWEIKGVYPFHEHRLGVDTTHVVIGTSGSKSAEQIARDIVRRFLDAYRAELASRNEQAAKAARANDERDALARELGTLVGKQPQSGQRGDRPKIWVGDAFGERCYADIEVNSGSSVNIELHSLTPEQARTVIAALKA